MSARRGITYLLGGNAGVFVIQFGGAIVMARLLSPSEMGVYAASMAVLAIINGVLNVGLQSYMVREREMPPAKLGTVFTLTFAQSAFFGLALLLGAPVVGWFTHDTRVEQSFRILAWFGTLNPVLMTIYGLMQRQQKFERVVLATLVNVGVAILFSILFAANGFSWRSMPLASGVGVTTALLLAAFLQRRDLADVRLSREYLQSMLAFGGRIAGASLILNITNRLPEILLTRAAGAAATGMYNRGASLIDTFNNSVMLSVGRVMGTQMAHDRDTSAGIGPIYAKMSRYVTGLFWPAFGLLAVLSHPIVMRLFGARWMAAAPVLAIIAASGAINLIVSNRAGVLVTVGRERDLPRLEAVRGVIGVVLFTMAAYWGGLIWAALTRVVDAIVAVLLYSPGIHAATGLPWSAMARAVARSAVVAAITVAPALAAMIVLGWPQSLSWPELIGLLAVSAAVWLGALFLVGHELTDEIVRVLSTARAMLPRQASRI